tara:strand:- start:981 stop:1412 length:432 start_codon:yes stop_codon:yes gene_type:complete
MKISIASDHAGVLYKKEIIKFLIYKNIKVKDFGPNTEESVDYPDFAHLVAESVKNKEVNFGILLCGSGNGINMSANKHQEIRSALCWKKEIAQLSRQHNDANILAMPARFITLDQAKVITKEFIQTKFEGGRHINRVNKIAYK